MENTINYESLVRAIHPDVRSSHVGNTRGYDQFYVWIEEKLLPIGFSTKSYEESWRDAYENIKSKTA